jgi:hypothetical protein
VELAALNVQEIMEAQAGSSKEREPEELPSSLVANIYDK